MVCLSLTMVKTWTRVSSVGMFMTKCLLIGRKLMSLASQDDQACQKLWPPMGRKVCRILYAGDVEDVVVHASLGSPGSYVIKDIPTLFAKNWASTDFLT